MEYDRLQESAPWQLLMNENIMPDFIPCKSLGRSKMRASGTTDAPQFCALLVGLFQKVLD